MRASQVTLVIKNVGDTTATVLPLGGKDPLAWEIAPHSSILAWKIPWVQEPRDLQPIGLQRVGHN